MPSVAAQQTLLSVSEAFKSFKELRQLFFRGELDQKPKPPDYRDSGSVFKVAFPNIGAGKPTLENGMIRFPLGLQVNRWFGLKEFFLPLPKNLDFAGNVSDLLFSAQNDAVMEVPAIRGT